MIVASIILSLLGVREPVKILLQKLRCLMEIFEGPILTHGEHGQLNKTCVLCLSKVAGFDNFLTFSRYVNEYICNVVIC